MAEKEGKSAEGRGCCSRCMDDEFIRTMRERCEKMAGGDCAAFMEQCMSAFHDRSQQKERNNGEKNEA